MTVDKKESMQTEEVCCPVCGSAPTAVLFSRADQYAPDNRHWTVRRCTCGAGMVSPRPILSEMHRVYPSFYAIPAPGPSLLSKAEQWYRRDLLDWETRLFRTATGLTQGAIVDIGTGSGDRLDSFTRAGYSAIGIEPFTSRSASIPFLSIGEAVASGIRFEAVSFNNSFEHLHDPRAALASAHALLKMNGVLAITIPNRRSFQARIFKHRWAAYDVPRDLYFLSADDIDTMATGAGFSKIAIFTANPLLHPPTLVLSCFPSLDPRLSFKERSGSATKVRILLWCIATILLSPLAWIESKLGAGSMQYAFFRKSHE